MKIKNKNAVFIVELSDTFLKVAECGGVRAGKRVFYAFESEPLPIDIDALSLSEKLKGIFKKNKYSNNPIVIGLPSNKVTCRYLKIPASDPDEIAKIAALQASKYLPYSVNELVSGYQLIETDKDGYSYVNLVIAHKEILERCLNLIKEFKASKFKIVLSSYGLCNLYYHINPQDSKTVMIVDVDTTSAELIIASNKKVLFSRYFKFNKASASWENAFISEINKSRDAYLKETSKEPPAKVVLFGRESAYQGAGKLLEERLNLPVEVLSYAQNIKFPGDLSRKILNSDISFAEAIGLGLADIEDSLNLLPQDIKIELKKAARYKERLRMIFALTGIIVMLTAVSLKNLEKKGVYLAQLKAELDKIEDKALPLEGIEKRLQLFQKRAQEESLALESINELHTITPEGVTLTNFGYEEGRQIILHGQSPELSLVFEFVAQLKKSAVFKVFDIKVKYASQRRINEDEIVEFEIICLK